MSAGTWIAVCLLGGLGAVLRYVVTHEVQARRTSPFPLGTLVVNLTGAFALGVLAAAVSGDALSVVGTGLLGGYTTFSTWILESERIGKTGRPGTAAANLVVSLVLGLLVAWLGIQLGELL